MSLNFLCVVCIMQWDEGKVFEQQQQQQQEQQQDVDNSCKGVLHVGGVWLPCIVVHDVLDCQLTHASVLQHVMWTITTTDALPCQGEQPMQRESGSSLLEGQLTHSGLRRVVVTIKMDKYVHSE